MLYICQIQEAPQKPQWKGSTFIHLTFHEKGNGHQVRILTLLSALSHVCNLLLDPQPRERLVPVQPSVAFHMVLQRPVLQPAFKSLLEKARRMWGAVGGQERCMPSKSACSLVEKTKSGAAAG